MFSKKKCCIQTTNDQLLINRFIETKLEDYYNNTTRPSLLVSDSVHTCRMIHVCSVSCMYIYLQSYINSYNNELTFFLTSSSHGQCSSTWTAPHVHIHPPKIRNCSLDVPNIPSEVHIVFNIAHTVNMQSWVYNIHIDARCIHCEDNAYTGVNVTQCRLNPCLNIVSKCQVYNAYIVN